VHNNNKRLFFRKNGFFVPASRRRQDSGLIGAGNDDLSQGMTAFFFSKKKAFLYRLHGAGKTLDLSAQGMTTFPARALADLAHLQVACEFSLV
jgi:hypothetical protein